MRKTYIIFSLFLLLCTSAFGQFEQTAAKLKVTYIYNFIQAFDWPTDYKQGDFVIGVINATPAMLEALTKMAASKTHNSQKLVIKNFKSVAEINKCNVLYIPENSNGLLEVVLKKMKGKSTLLITESEGDAKKGSAINFIYKDSKLKFELNETIAKKNHLEVSSQLKTMAINVE